MSPMMLLASNRRKCKIILFVCSMLAMVSFVHYMYVVPSKSGLTINQIIVPVGPTKVDPSRGCIMPKLSSVLAAEESYNLKMKPLECGGSPNWIYIDNGTIQWNRDILRKHSGRIICNIRYLVRQDDFHQVLSSHSVEFNSETTESLILEDDYFQADCKTKPSGIMETVYHFQNYFAGIKLQEEVLARKNSEPKSENPSPNKLNILVFGFDSVSRMNFIRRVPNLYEYLTKKLNAVVLQNHNIVGDGTTAQLLGSFAGVYEEQEPETRRGKSKTTCDVYPFIWKKANRERYVTGYAEDESSIGTFQYRLNGFKVPPTDHYMRPFHLMIETKDKKSKTYCLGGEPKINVLMRWCEEIFKVYPKDVTKFVFGFHSEYSHSQVSEVNLADEPVTAWMRHLHESGILNNTILMVMSDHGHRFALSRSSLQGKYEERLPIFTVIPPPWFKDTFPNAHKSLVINGADRLTTPFDIHATFNDILDYINKGIDTPSKHNQKNLSRGLSLFREIPIERTCDDAQIPIHWCACSSWVPVNDYISDEIARKVITAVVKSINDLIEQSGQNDICHQLTLSDVKRVQKMIPKKEMLAFKKTSDHDGRVPDLSDKETKVPEVVYEVQLVLSPGDGIFESTVKYMIANDSIIMSTKDISRVNKYGSASHCISSTYPHLSKFCYCKQQKSASELEEDSYQKVIQG